MSDSLQPYGQRTVLSKPLKFANSWFYHHGYSCARDKGTGELKSVSQGGSFKAQNLGGRPLV